VSNKRIILEYLTGLRKIIGYFDGVSPAVQYLDRLDDCDLGGRTGTVALVKVAPKYVLYQEQAPPPPVTDN
jgi:hypothetical protein